MGKIKLNLQDWDESDYWLELGSLYQDAKDAGDLGLRRDILKLLGTHKEFVKLPGAMLDRQKREESNKGSDDDRQTLISAIPADAEDR